MSANGFNVYLGKNSKGKIVYVGTTIQKPAERWRWHKYNGKDLNFELIKNCSTSEEMLNLELELINKYNPSLNKIKHRKQNLNKKLTNEQLNLRKGDKEWCQCCLKRRVKSGYSVCFFCN